MMMHALMSHGAHSYAGLFFHQWSSFTRQSMCSFSVSVHTVELVIFGGNSISVFFGRSRFSTENNPLNGNNRLSVVMTLHVSHCTCVIVIIANYLHY